MARSLYARLFRYIACDGRTPLENFLTEALADIANRLPSADHGGFLGAVLLAGVDVRRRAAILDAVTRAGTCEWTTQQAIVQGGTKKYPDLLLLVDGRPTVLVENKLAASFTTHEERVADAVRVLDQLTIYGRWLAGQNPSGALVLLTHETEPPPGFELGGDYSVEARGVCRWRHVHHWLKAVGARSGVGPTAATLARELAEFLAQTEETMGVDDPGPLEFSLVQAYHRLAHAKLQNAMKEIARFVQARHPGGTTLSPMNVGDEGYRLCGWYRLKPTNHPSDWYVSWGILLPGAPPWPVEPTPPLPGHEVAFVLATSDNDNFPAHLVDQRPAGWHWPQRQQRHYGPVKTRPLAEVYGSPRGFTEEFKVWVEPALDDALEIFDAVARAR